MLVLAVAVAVVVAVVLVVNRPPGASDGIAVDSGLVDVTRLRVAEEVEAIDIGGDNTPVIWRGGDGGGKITKRGVGAGSGVTNTARGVGVGADVGSFMITSGVGAQTQTFPLQSQPPRKHELAH
jgi:hypothetical protein